MKSTCGCCEGREALTPSATLNRPGLSALVYRAGTHATFLETMLARLSSLYIELDQFDAASGQPVASQIKPLLGLTTRDTADPSIALMDAWAAVADVLTFYQERIANEGFLRTATERLSVLEMARLVGYRLRPGVAASVYLAYTLEKDSAVTIPAGSRSQTVPGPGELPQSFETSEPLDADAAWNTLRPRQTRPQKIDLSNAAKIDTLTFEGIQTNLQPNDPLLLVFGEAENQQVLRHVLKVDVQTSANRTQVSLQPVPVFNTALVEAHLTAARYLELDQFEVTKNETTAARVVQNYLEPLQQMTEANLSQVHEMLPSLKAELKRAQRHGYERLEPWLSAMVEDLEGVARGVPRADPQSIKKSAAGVPANTSTVEGIKVQTPGQQQQQQSNVTSLGEILGPLQVPASTPPANALRLSRSTNQVFQARGDVVPKLLTSLQPALQSSLYKAMANAAVTPESPVEVYALRVTAPLFGYNAAPTRPQPFRQDNSSGVIGVADTSLAATSGPPVLSSVPYDPEWHVADPVYGPVGNGFQLKGKVVYEERNVVNLDTTYDKIVPGSWVVVRTEETPITDRAILFARAASTNASAGRAVYGMSGKTTRIELGSPSGQGSTPFWINRDLDAIDPFKPGFPIEGDFKAVRSTVVHAQSELLTLAEEPIDPVEEAICKDHIDLDGLYENLQPGRWLIISGERTDIPNVTGVLATELTMLAGIEQRYDEDLPGDKIHTEIQLSTPLAYCYKRDTVTIYGNVVKATHGETRSEVLGSGNSTQTMQRFTLKQSPLTYLAAATPRGAEDTLQVRVNDVLWHEAPDIYNLTPRDHSFVTETDDEDRTTVFFGDGKHGARLPTGVENVTALYRTGIGKAGNASAGKISQLASRPLGVKEVVNPLPATGGADREDRDQARRNAPLGVMALDRLISVKDYEDFARTFAGIAKASAARLSDGRRQLVHLTIAGTDDIPIDTSSDLYLNLRLALLKFGDPSQALGLAVRYLKLLVIRAGVRVAADYQWESVEPKISAALLDRFGFDKRELGQSVYLSEVVSAIQGVEGVEYVLMERLDTIREDASVEDLSKLGQNLKLNEYVPARLATLDKQAANRADPIRPAELIFLSPDVPETLYLYELKA